MTLSVNDSKIWIKRRNRITLKSLVPEGWEEEAAGSPKTLQCRAFPWVDCYEQELENDQ